MPGGLGEAFGHAYELTAQSRRRRGRLGGPGRWSRTAGRAPGRRTSWGALESGTDGGWRHHVQLEMADLDSYMGKVLEEQDKVLLREASDCLRTGARRAAYITVWLATAEALRRKFFLAQAFDGQAAHIVRMIQQREVDHKAIDALLINKAREYGFISDAESQRLRHLYENRNIYGHPYEESPSDAAVVAAAVDAVEVVLGRHVRLRHGYLDRQVVRLTTDAAFLADDPDAIAGFAEQVHRRSGGDLRLWLVRKMLNALAPIFADPSQDLLQRRGVQFLRAFLLADSSVFEEWEAVDDLPDHPEVLPGLLADGELFAHISNHAKDIVVNVLVQRSPADPRCLELLWQLKEDGALTTRHVALMNTVLESMPLDRFTGRGLPLRAYWTRIARGLSSHSWVPQNLAISVLRNAGPLQVGGLDDAAQEELGRQVMQAAEGTAWRASDLLGELSTVEPPWPPNFIEGAAVEPFLAVDGQVRLKPRETVRALRGLSSLDAPARDGVIDRIRDGIAVGLVRDPSLFSRERDEVVQALRSMANQARLDRVTELADAIQAKDVPDAET